MAKIGTVSAPGVVAQPRGRLAAKEPTEPRVRLAELFAVKNKALVWWGLFTFLVYSIPLLLPTPVAHFNAFRMAAMINGALFAATAISILRLKIYLIPAVWAFFAMQAWATVSYFYGFTVTARDDAWGKQLFFAYEIVMPYFSAWVLCQLNPQWRAAIMNWLLWLLTLSAVVGILQFIHFPGFDSVYKAYAFSTVYDLSGETYKGVRAVGLAAHPLTLGVECMTALAIIGSRFLYRGMRWYEFVHASILCLALVMTQGRTLYVAGGLVIMLVLLNLGKRRPEQAFVTLATIIALFAIAAAFFPDKFTYAFSKIGVSGRDTFAVRKEIWANYREVFSEFAITGIGPDSAIFGAGYGLPGRWSLRLMENAYLAFYAMLGIPGLTLYILGLAATVYGTVRVIKSKVANPMWRRAAFVGLAFLIMLIVSSATGNMFDSNTVAHLGFLVGGIAAPLRNERL